MTSVSSHSIIGSFPRFHCRNNPQISSVILKGHTLLCCLNSEEGSAPHCHLGTLADRKPCTWRPQVCSVPAADKRGSRSYTSCCWVPPRDPPLYHSQLTHSSGGVTAVSVHPGTLNHLEMFPTPTLTSREPTKTVLQRPRPKPDCFS